MVRAVLGPAYGFFVFAATLALLIVVSNLSFRYVETPLLRLKRRFETKDQREGDELTRLSAK
jgi:peptidoglycan/LPS O-acetylase OafA/YrhL